ncbi:MAG TPA: glycoside hydrolase domain-containing protein [Tepidisphaeraceae bacterium]|nr:glycoside hydrolase domain-containing protein [Tepidisphaeraceae bacterium]
MKRKVAVVAVVVLAFASPLLALEKLEYRVARTPWDEAMGNHRAIVHVDQKAEAVSVIIPWRRHEREPEKRNIIVIDASSGERVKNVSRGELTRETGNIVFQPKAAGDYYIYYAPFKTQPGWGFYSGDYTPIEETADAAWSKTKPSGSAKAIAIESRLDFDQVDPMEVIATHEETETLRKQHAGEPMLLFPEDRKFPIRMTDDLPYRWLERGPTDHFEAEAQRNEFYAFQVGIYAAGADLSDVRTVFSDFKGPEGAILDASHFNCFNTNGRDPNGDAVYTTINIAKGKVQALWFGIDVPADIAPGDYRGTLKIGGSGIAGKEIQIALKVLSTTLADRGDSEPWRHSRLRWLDSMAGMDDQIVAPYTALKAAAKKKKSMSFLGRELEYGPDGSLTQISASGEPLLTKPLSFVVETAKGPVVFKGDPLMEILKSPGTAVFETRRTGGDLRLRVQLTMQFDGHLDCRYTLSADRDVKVKDIRLEIPLKKSAATYFMGAGRKGGLRPSNYEWRWSGPYDSFWIGDVPGGLHVELRGATYNGPMLNLYHPAPPASWSNSGKGGVSISEGKDDVTVRCFSGARTLSAGETLNFDAGILITPVKPLDPQKHFATRYYHGSPLAPPDEDVKAGVNVVNVHHDTEPNPYINYPFIATKAMKDFVDAQHARGLKVKIYYTVRELTNHVTEIWALRSLGNEIFADGSGGGYPWLREHLVDHYTPSWYNTVPGGTIDASITTSGESRWYNYYIEGLGWLVKNVGIDGLYLDDVAYDRTILQRMRKVMDRAKPGCMIDLHSNTAFSIGPMNQYAEFFPYIDRLWFGESFKYNEEPPDYWLTEISGIPFGLMGDMLQDGGNRWRGMIYGMTARLPWDSDKFKANPKPMWKTWDEFGIGGAKMIGYWDKACPVRANNPNVLATAYVRPDRTMIAIASWDPKPADVKLAIDWKALGLEESTTKLHAPAIKDFQKEKTFTPSDTIPVQPTQGWILIAGQ